jgi:hypothetical protein
MSPRSSELLALPRRSSWVIPWGVSWLAYASEHDVRAVVNVDLSLDPRPLQARIRTFESRLRGASYSDTMRAMLAALAGDAVSDATRAAIEVHAARAPAEVVLGVYDILLRTSDEDLLTMAEGLMNNISAPYLLMHGAEPSPEYTQWVTLTSVTSPSTCFLTAATSSTWSTHRGSFSACVTFWRQCPRRRHQETAPQPDWAMRVTTR